jgi:hypothetical protein
MEQVIQLIINAGGVWAIPVILLLYVCKRLYDDKETIQEKRITEAQRGIEAIEKSTAALNALTTLITAQRRGEV